MKVGSLFAEIGFKVDQKGLEKFSDALKAFQKTIRDGLKDLREYARVAREISNAFRGTSLPGRRTRRGYSQGSVAENARAYLDAQRARFFEQDSNTRASNARSRAKALELKEKGLIGTHTGKYSQGILAILRGIAGFSIGGVAGGFAAMAGFSHPIVSAITIGVKAIIAAINLVMKTVREGVRSAMSYRDYMAFTGRSTRGLSALMAASLNTTNLTPEDIMKDAAGFEKQYWDMFFGGGNPRAWQMAGILPTGNGEVDMKNIMAFVWGATNGLQNRGLARSLFGQFNMSEEYITLIEDLMRENPGATIKELFERTREQIELLEDGNKTLREYDRTWRELRVELAKIFLDAGIADVLKELVQGLKELIMWLRGFTEWKKGDTWGAKVYRTISDISTINPITNPVGLAKMILGEAGGTNNVSSNVTNHITVSSPDEAAEFVQKSQYIGLKDAWWGKGEYNSSDRMAPSIG